VAAEPTVVFGLGATKAGTSWLHDHLAGHPECHFRTIKELHYFGLTEAQQFDWQLDHGRREIEVAREAGERGVARLRDLRDWQKVLRMRVIDAAAYLGYLTGGRKDRRIVGDITPAYSLLPPDTLRTMAGLSPDVRFIYLLRDPVARLWSHVRMIAQRTVPDRFGDESTALMGRVLDGDLSGEGDGIVRRGDYAGILAKLDAALDPRRLLVMFYEDLTSLPGIARLSAFLGIAPRADRLDRRVHEGRAIALPKALQDRARQVLRSQYDVVSGRFPVLPEAWQRNMEGSVA
jgi:hypothetical protein